MTIWFMTINFIHYITNLCTKNTQKIQTKELIKTCIIQIIQGLSKTENVNNLYTSKFI